MIEVLILLGATLTEKLNDLPAPSTIAQSVMRHNSEAEYRALITKSKSIAASIHVTSLAELQSAIKSWCDHGKAAHRELRKKFAKAGDPTFRTIEIDTKMSQFDLTKLDFLLALKSQPPIFHTKLWLSRVYSASFNKEGKIILADNPRYPHELAKHTGPDTDPPAASFETFLDSEYGQAVKWIDSGFKSKRPPEMTVERLAKKL